MFVFTTWNFNNYNQSFCIGDQSIHPSIHPLTAMLIFGTTLLIQNAAARLVFNGPKRAHVTPLFIFLHWLPVAARIQFKTLMLAYRKITGSTPAYFHSLITIYIPSRSLRSASELTPRGTITERLKITLQNILFHRSWPVEGASYPYPECWKPSTF